MEQEEKLLKRITRIVLWGVKRFYPQEDFTMNISVKFTTKGSLVESSINGGWVKNTTYGQVSD